MKRSIKQRKLYAQRMYDLGWYEDEHNNWRCQKCKELRAFLDCGICKRCELCYPCKPDTEAGVAAQNEYQTKKAAKIDFDIFGEPFPNKSSD